MNDDIETLLIRIKQDDEPVWTLDRVKLILGPDTSDDTCTRVLRRLERMRVLEPKGDGTWVRAWPGGAQRDWYS